MEYGDLVNMVIQIRIKYTADDFKPVVRPANVIWGQCHQAFKLNFKFIIFV